LTLRAGEKMNGSLTYLNAVLFGFSLVSCATIASGSHESFSVRSNPDKAQVIIKNSRDITIVESTSPFEVELSRGKGYFSPESYTIDISKDGYIPRRFRLDSHLNGGWYLAGNVFSGNWIGWFVVDPLTGAMWEFDAKSITVDLVPVATSTFPNALELGLERVGGTKVHYNPWLAGFLGLYPGGGHYYQGQWGTGLLLTASSALLQWAAFTLGYAGQANKP